MKKKNIPPISFGVDYYPEHWPKERWAEVIRLMKEMGIGGMALTNTYARLAIYSEGRITLEPGNRPEGGFLGMPEAAGR